MPEPAVVDAWMQHPTASFLAEPMLDSLRRGRVAGPVPRSSNIGARPFVGLAPCTARVMLNLSQCCGGPLCPPSARDPILAQPRRILTAGRTRSIPNTTAELILDSL